VEDQKPIGVMQINILMKQLEYANPDLVICHPVRIRKTLTTAVIILKTAIRDQSVLKVNISIRKQNTVKISALQVVKIQMKFHSADSARKKVKYYSQIANLIPSVEMENPHHSHVGLINILMS
jgi:hypothetical protein